MRDRRHQPCKAGEDPSVIPGKDGPHQYQACRNEQTRCARFQLAALNLIACQNPAELRKQQRRPDHLGQKERLGHRRRLHVEQARDSARKRARQPTLRPRPATPAPAGKFRRSRVCNSQWTESRPPVRSATKPFARRRESSADAASGSHTEPSWRKPGLRESRTRRAMCKCATASPYNSNKGRAGRSSRRRRPPAARRPAQQAATPARVVCYPEAHGSRRFQSSSHSPLHSPFSQGEKARGSARIAASISSRLSSCIRSVPNFSTANEPITPP